MFDLEHNDKLWFASEVLGSEVNHRTLKNDLNYCADAVPDQFDLAENITDLISLKKPGKLQETKKLYHGVLQFEDDGDMECESLEYDDYYVLSEDSDTAEILVSDICNK